MTVTITGVGFTIDAVEHTEYTAAPPITVTPGVAGEPIRIASNYENVRNGGPSIIVQVDDNPPAILTPTRVMRVNLRAGRTVMIMEQP